MKQLITITLRRDNNDKYSFYVIEYSPEIQTAKGEKFRIYNTSEHESILTIETDFNTGDLDPWKSAELNNKRKKDIDVAKLKLIDNEKQRLFARETSLNNLKQSVVVQSE